VQAIPQPKTYEFHWLTRPDLKRGVVTGAASGIGGAAIICVIDGGKYIPRQLVDEVKVASNPSRMIISAGPQIEPQKPQNPRPPIASEALHFGGLSLLAGLSVACLLSIRRRYLHYQADRQDYEHSRQALIEHYVEQEAAQLNYHPDPVARIIKPRGNI
jgi:hypothetical protein